MSFQKFDEECPGCRPAMMDVKTGKVLPDDSPQMKVVLALWAKTFKQEREAFHRVTCQNSRSESDMRLFTGLMERVQAALSQAPQASAD